MGGRGSGFLHVNTLFVKNREGEGVPGPILNELKIKGLLWELLMSTQKTFVQYIDIHVWVSSPNKNVT